MMPTTQSEGTISRRAAFLDNAAASTSVAPPNSGTAAIAPSSISDAAQALAQHWPEYLVEAAGLGIFRTALVPYKKKFFQGD